jgi:hypothetical protein
MTPKTKQTPSLEELKQEVLESLTIEELREEMRTRAGLSDIAKAEAKSAKKAGFAPSYLRIGGREFLYRALGRKEWREQIKAQNVKIVDAGEDHVLIAEIKEDAKEDMVKAGLLWTELGDSEMPAGTIEMLADAILLESGFGPPESEPVRL